MDRDSMPPSSSPPSFATSAYPSRTRKRETDGTRVKRGARYRRFRRRQFLKPGCQRVPLSISLSRETNIPRWREARARDFHFNDAFIFSVIRGSLVDARRDPLYRAFRTAFWPDSFHSRGCDECVGASRAHARLNTTRKRISSENSFNRSLAPLSNLFSVFLLIRRYVNEDGYANGICFLRHVE